MIINYGIGENYLKDWGIQEALREIYQNFMDYGKFTQKAIPDGGSNFTVLLNSNYNPENLEFLKIGESNKNGNEQAIGQHGEGLKMALLVFLRLNYEMEINTPKYNIQASWNEQSFIGKSLCLIIKEKSISTGFNIRLVLPKEEFTKFNNNLIKQKDTVYSDNYHGDIVNKEVGNLYVGKLFVANIKNFKKSYNLPPNLIKLDRDRKIPGAFETSYHTSKINEGQAKLNASIDFKDQSYDDFKHINSIPVNLYEQIKPKVIGNSFRFVHIDKTGGEIKETVITNENIINHLKSQTFFEKAINGIKRFLVAKLGVKDLLISFRQKYCYNEDAKKDFDIILERLGIDLND